ncbi:DUF6382 domain-containing protein [Paenibacillus turpanensis]|uniref:DUF6382 domain-containing protein n=1 Tax=Paenibacillus turpanensis TaxID=2689078 RepID=UPI00140DB62A|nr:DUF6382 domain-containing protein [Paenibacillus turpanensis]
MTLQLQLHGRPVQFESAGGKQLLTVSVADRLELSGSEVSMLRHCRIPSLLVLSVEERNLDVRLCYNVTGRRSLSQQLRSGAFSRTEACHILLQIISIIQSGAPYLLKQDGFVLDEQYIFTSELSGEYRLLYLPLRREKEDAAFSEQFLDLAERLFGGNGEFRDFVRKEGGPPSVIVHWKRLVEGFEFPSSGDDRLFRDHLSEGAARSHLKLAATHSENAGGTMFSAPGQSAGNKEEKKQTAQTLLDVMNAARVTPKAAEGGGELINPKGGQGKPPSKHSALGRGMGESPEWFASMLEEEFEEGATPGKGRFKELLTDKGVGLWTVLTCTAGIAVVWLPSEGLLYTALGCLSEVVRRVVLAMAAAPALAAESDVYDTGELQGEFLAVKNDVQMSEWCQTSFLPESDATVFLGAGWKPDPTRLLLIEHEGKERTVPWKTERFVLGRGPEGVDYEAASSGISRQHVEWSTSDKGIFIKDLGSRNGTRLNGELLQPFTLYPLKEGDTVTVLTFEVTLRIA